ncbi:MAG: protein kinase [Alphaproteobacteria bacterium]|nr:protein kinase [Alphaproteobacteria bacterium]
MDGRRFEILGVIGRGGMGSIYRARMVGAAGFAKQVALKVATPGSTSEGDVQRLRDEGRLLGLLRHRAIVAVDGLTQLDGSWAVVMEYVEGSDLATLLERSGPVPPGTALEIVAEILAALECARATRDANGRPLHLQHRDIKPGNVLITPHGEVKVLDFGIARASFAARETVTTDQQYGSAGYMAPERLDGIDHAHADVYSTGVVLFELLAGKRLGKASSHRGRFDAWMAESLAALETPEPVADLLRHLMAYDPDERPGPDMAARAVLETRGEITSPSLREWAARHVPDALAAAPSPEPGAFSVGDILSEATSDQELASFEALVRATLPPAARRVQMRGTPPALPRLDSLEEPAVERERDALPLALAAAGGAFLAAALLLALVMAGSDAPGPPLAQADLVPAPVQAGLQVASPEPIAVPEPVEAPPEPAPEPVDAPSELVETAPEPVEAPPDTVETPPEPAEPSVAPAPPVVPEPAPVAVAPRPSVRPAPTPRAARSRVEIEGDATSVRLVGTQGTRGSYTIPGRVPAGTYTIQAHFEDGRVTPAGTVTVEAGAPLVLACNGLFARCTAR